MRRSSIAALCGLLLLAPAAHADDGPVAAANVEVAKVDANSWRLTLYQGAPVVIVDAQATLRPKARELCDGKRVQFGRYVFAVHGLGSDDAPDRHYKVDQMVFCIDAPTDVDTGEGWQPGAADEKIVQNLTRDYLAAEDNIDYAKAVTYMDDGMKAVSLPAEWTADRNTVRQKLGTLISRELTTTKWFKDPPGDFVPGYYVMVSFTSTYGNAVAACGEIAWRRAAGGRYRLVNEGFGYLSKDDAARLDGQTKARVLAQIACP